MGGIEGGVLRGLNDKIHYPPPPLLEIKIDLSFWTRNNIGSVKRGTGLAEYIARRFRWLFIVSMTNSTRNESALAH
jgi:hypothetical protein